MLIMLDTPTIDRFINFRRRYLIINMLNIGLITG